MPLPRLCTYQNRTRCPSIFETVTAIFRHTVSNQRSLPFNECPSCDSDFVAFGGVLQILFRLLTRLTM